MQARGDSQLGDEVRCSTLVCTLSSLVHLSLILCHLSTQSEYVASDLFATDSLRSLYNPAAADEEASVRGHVLAGQEVRIARRFKL